MGKARRIKEARQKKADQQKLIQEGINYLCFDNQEADIYIVTVPGVGSVNVTDQINLRRSA